MTNHAQPIVVGVNGTPESDLAVRWAAAEATGRGVGLKLVHAYTWPPVYGGLGAYPMGDTIDPTNVRKASEQLVEAAAEVARSSGSAGLDVATSVVEGRRIRELLDASAHASLVVVGSRRLGPLGSTVLGSTGAAVAARAACPAVVVRGPAGLPEEGARVVVGVDLSELSEPTLGFAFEHASRARVPLTATLYWNPTPSLMAHWADLEPDGFRTRGKIMLAEALAGWQEKFPDVHVERKLIDIHPVNGLVAESQTAHLLVVGAQGRHARVGTFLGSVSQGVLHHATCPVAVVHASD